MTESDEVRKAIAAFRRSVLALVELRCGPFGARGGAWCVVKINPVGTRHVVDWHAVKALFPNAKET